MDNPQCLLFVQWTILIFEMSHFECLRSHILCNHLFLAVYVQMLFPLQIRYGTKRITLPNVWRLQHTPEIL